MFNMASEKQVQFNMDDTLEPLPSASQKQRRNAMRVLGGAALLATGMAIGLSASMFCANNLGADLRVISAPIVSANPNNMVYDLSGRSAVVGSTVSTAKVEVVGVGRLVLAATRPLKFFGPTLSPAQAKIFKQNNKLSSIEKKEVSEEAKIIEGRDVTSVATTDLTGTTANTNTAVGRIWQPAPGLNWTYQLDQPPNSTQLQNPGKYQVWDIDLFDTPQSSIQTIQAAGSKVICYFSGGTWENWRSDAGQFQAADIGTPMGDWPGEDWINTNSATVRKIMAARMDLAKSKGCDAVDPDNMDAYNHVTGFNLTMNDAVNYVTYLSQQAQARGLALSLKNSGDIISKVISLVQFSVEEACYAYDECSLYSPFTSASKAVFHVEYPKGYGVVNTNPVSSSTMTAICACKSQYHLSPIVKNNDLDTWQQACP